MERSFLDPIGAEMRPRSKPLGKIRVEPSEMTVRPERTRSVPSRISATGAASLSRRPQPVTAPGHTLTLNESAARIISLQAQAFADHENEAWEDVWIPRRRFGCLAARGAELFRNVPLDPYRRSRPRPGATIYGLANDLLIVSRRLIVPRGIGMPLASKSTLC
jgi:hypothetical protein